LEWGFKPVCIEVSQRCMQRNILVLGLLPRLMLFRSERMLPV
jgi:hypothetical protein